MKTIPKLFEAATEYLNNHKGPVPIGVDLDIMTLAPENLYQMSGNGYETLYEVEINFRGYLGNPVIQSFYNITFHDLKIIRMELIVSPM
jgi:hypothetical protein